MKKEDFEQNEVDKMSWILDESIYPILLFLDTQCLINNKFDFHNHSFNTIKKFIDIGFIELISTKIIENEVNNKIKNVTEESKKKLNGIINEKYIDEFILNRDFSYGKIYEDFCEDFKVNDITNAVSINMMNVFDDYFNKLPPFNKNENDKKKAEFPDAFNIKCVISYVHKRVKKCVVITNDSDYKNVFKCESNIFIFDKIKDFVDKLNEKKHSILYNRVIEYIEKNISKINDNIKNNFIDIEDFKPGDFFWDYNIDDFEINKFEKENILILEIPEDEKEVSSEIKFSGNCTLYISCPAQVYDPVDREFITLGRNKNKLDLDFSFDCTISINFHTNEFEIYDNKFRHETFNIPDEWSEVSWNPDWEE